MIFNPKVLRKAQEFWINLGYYLSFLFHIFIVHIDLDIYILYLIQIWQVEVLVVAKVDHGRMVNLLNPHQYLPTSGALHPAPPLQHPPLSLFNLTCKVSTWYPFLGLWLLILYHHHPFKHSLHLWVLLLLPLPYSEVTLEQLLHHVCSSYKQPPEDTTASICGLIKVPSK